MHDRAPVGPGRLPVTDEVNEAVNKDIYSKLNYDAKKLIIKHAQAKRVDEMDFVSWLKEGGKQRAIGIKDVPALKRQAAKYYKEYESNRRKGIEEYRKQQLAKFQVKSQGTTDLHRHLRKEPATPLVAVRRKGRGGPWPTKGQHCHFSKRD